MAPVRQVEAHYTEPPIRHGCKVNWLLMLGPAGITLALSTFSNSAFLVWMFALTLFVWVPVYYFALYRKQKAATIERIRNSAEYQQQCTAARMAANRQQLDFDEAYTKDPSESADAFARCCLSPPAQRYPLRSSAPRWWG